MDIRNWKSPCVLLCIALILAVPARSGQTPAEWPESSPAREGLNPDALGRMDRHIQAELPHLRSLLIARHGRLVFEKYYGDASRDRLHNMQSMTKSVSSALVGIALRKGLIPSLDIPLVNYLSEYRSGIQDPRIGAITIRHLLTMSSGVDEMQLSFDHVFDNPVAEILKRPLLFAPGQGFKYSSPAAHLLGAVLRKATGQSVLAFAEAELFGPLGMGSVEWYADKTGLQSGGMSGLWRPRDLLKLGELYLRRGQWAGRDIVPAAYVADSVKTHNTGDFYGSKVRYGYMWWIDDIAGHNTFRAAGYGGQYVTVIPDADLVVLCTSDWKKPEYPEHFALLEKSVLPAIVAK